MTHFLQSQSENFQLSILIKPQLVSRAKGSRLSSWLWTEADFCLSLCLYVCLSVCMSVCLSACLSVCLHVCLRVRVSVCLCVHPSACLPVCVSVRLCVCLSVCMSVCLCACLPVYQCVCLPVIWLLFKWWCWSFSSLVQWIKHSYTSAFHITSRDTFNTLVNGRNLFSDKKTLKQTGQASDKLTIHFLSLLQVL